MQLTAHKCNLQRINATFAENKCNFLALLLQQKLALLMILLWAWAHFEMFLFRCFSFVGQCFLFFFRKSYLYNFCKFLKTIWWKFSEDYCVLPTKLLSGICLCCWNYTLFIFIKHMCCWHACRTNCMYDS